MIFLPPRTVVKLLRTDRMNIDMNIKQVTKNADIMTLTWASMYSVV